ncbi:histidine kinase [Chryseobacterium sp.]|uniref:sensor histidine kinase n=1 Tax=Chryseobacterium sp. TaxID=1871047 RepID=UPI003340C43B
MKKLAVFISFLTFFFSPFFSPQIPGLVNYGEESGLNNSYTYSLSQDHNGYIWVGSDNGLFRFDGKEFKQYSKKSGLKNLEILSSLPLDNGEIFIFPFLNDFAYLKDGHIINSDSNKELRKIQFRYNVNYSTDNHSIYIFTGHNPKSIYLFKDEKVTKIPLYFNTHNPSDIYYALALDVKTHLLYLSSKEKKENLLAYDIFTKQTTKCNVYLEKDAVVYKKGNFFIFRDKRKITIYKLYNKFTFKKIQTYSVNENIHQVIIDKNYRIWLCMEEGGALYFKQTLLDNKKLTAPIQFLSGNIINHLMVDKDNNTWFSTRNNGVYFITAKFLNSYIHLPIPNNSAYITAISKNDNSILLGYNESTAGIYNFHTIKDLVFEKNRKIEHKAIVSEKNMVFFGLSRSLVQYNTATGEKQILGDFNLKNLVPYTDSSILICSSEGLTAYHYLTRQYTEMIKQERVYTALSYDKDSLFVGNFKDLYKFSTRTKKKKLFLEDYYFTDLKKLSNNTYIGATNRNGIIIFSNKRILGKISENNGFPTNQIKKIEIENEKVFWASTNSGLSRIEIGGSHFRINNFTQPDGLPSNLVAGCAIKNDTIYVGTSKGLGILSVRDLLRQQRLIDKKAIINSVIIGYQEFFNLNQKLTTQAPNDDIIVNVSFPDYASQGKISYKYKIEGLSENWLISTSPKIILNSVPPGEYVLKIFGLGYNGRQTSVPTELYFEIKPRFWQTWWFKTLLILTGAVLLFIFINWYFQKKRNKKLETLYYEKKIAELELQAIKAQINPHFIYNCLNSIQFLLYKKNYEETENYLNVFSQMIRKTLYYSEKTFMPIKEEVEYLSLYLNMEKLRLKEQFEYTINVSETVNENWVIPSLLIQPFVENAIKHGIANITDRKGKIGIFFEYINASLCITIEDNGVGIGTINQSMTKKESFGVKLSQKRIETFKQLFETHITLEIKSFSGQESKHGTQIKLYITPYENQNTSMHH